VDKRSLLIKRLIKT